MSISKIEHDKTVVGIKVERRRKMAGTCVDVEDGCGDEHRLGRQETMSAKHTSHLHWRGNKKQAKKKKASPVNLKSSFGRYFSIFWFNFCLVSGGLHQSISFNSVVVLLIRFCFAGLGSQVPSSRAL